MGEAGEPRIEHARHDEEPPPFVIVVDCVGQPDEHGLLPFAIVLEEIKQALSKHEGLEARIAHVAIRENREEILYAVQAASDSEDRRRG